MQQDRSSFKAKLICMSYLPSSSEHSQGKNGLPSRPSLLTVLSNNSGTHYPQVQPLQTVAEVSCNVDTTAHYNQILKATPSIFKSKSIQTVSIRARALTLGQYGTANACNELSTCTEQSSHLGVVWGKIQSERPPRDAWSQGAHQSCVCPLEICAPSPLLPAWLALLPCLSRTK